MKMQILILGIITILMVSGCATQYVCDDGTSVSDPSMCKAEPEDEEKQEVVIDEEPEDIVVVEEEAPEELKPIVKEIDENIQKLFEKALSKRDNYKYTYEAPKNGYIKDVYVLGDQVKDSFRTNMFDGDKRYPRKSKYDHVYFNTAKETAKRMCLDEDSCENTTLVTKVDFDGFYMGTVMTLIDSVIYAKDTGSNEMVEGRRGLIVNYKLEDGEEGRMWVDNFYGTPIKKETKGDKITSKYLEFEPNFVTSEDVDMP